MTPLPAILSEKPGGPHRRWEAGLEEQGGEGMYQSGFGLESRRRSPWQPPMIQLWKTGASFRAQFSWALTPGPSA